MRWCQRQLGARYCARSHALPLAESALSAKSTPDHRAGQQCKCQQNLSRGALCHPAGYQQLLLHPSEALMERKKTETLSCDDPHVPSLVSRAGTCKMLSMGGRTERMSRRPRLQRILEPSRKVGVATRRSHVSLSFARESLTHRGSWPSCRSLSDNLPSPSTDIDAARYERHPAPLHTPPPITQAARPRRSTAARARAGAGEPTRHAPGVPGVPYVL